MARALLCRPRFCRAVEVRRRYPCGRPPGHHASNLYGRGVLQRPLRRRRLADHAVAHLAGGGTQLQLLGLSNGPTLAFKDMAMQLLGNLFEYTLAQSGEELNILGATSGDTGSAPPSTRMRGKERHPRLHAVAARPHERVPARADVLARKTTTSLNIAVEGMFDDCQDIVKAVSKDDSRSRPQHRRHGELDQLGARRRAGRLLLQGLAAGDRRSDGQKVSFSVPSGNFGNICAGHIARTMGLPIGRLVARRPTRTTCSTSSSAPASTVRAAAAETHRDLEPVDGHLESVELRALHLRPRRARPDRARRLFARQLESRAAFDFSGTPEFARSRVRLRLRHAAPTPTASPRSAVHERYGVTIDPHTADGVKVARRHLRDGVPMLVLETAMPAKFAETSARRSARSRSVPRRSRASKGSSSASRSCRPTSTASRRSSWSTPAADPTPVPHTPRSLSLPRTLTHPGP